MWPPRGFHNSFFVVLSSPTNISADFLWDRKKAVRGALSTNNCVRLRESAQNEMPYLSVEIKLKWWPLGQIYIYTHKQTHTSTHYTYIFRARSDFDFCCSREDLSVFEHSEFLPIPLLVGSLNGSALKGALSTLLLSLYISHCQDVVNTEGSHQKCYAPEARCRAGTTLNLPNFCLTL